MALITIQGVELPTPSDYTALTADIVDSGRNVQGKTVAQVVRSDVTKITVNWKYLTVKQWSDILKIFKSNFFVDVLYYDKVEMKYQTKTFYISDRQGGLAQLDKNGVPVAWLNCGFSLVEE